MFIDKLISRSVDSLKERIISLHQDYENGAIESVDPEQSWQRKSVRILRSASRIVFRYLVKDLLAKGGYEIKEGLHDYLEASKDGKTYLVLPYSPEDYFSFDDLVAFSKVGEVDAERVVVTNIHSKGSLCAMDMKIICGDSLVNLIVKDKGVEL